MRSTTFKMLSNVLDLPVCGLGTRRQAAAPWRATTAAGWRVEQLQINVDTTLSAPASSVIRPLSAPTRVGASREALILGFPFSVSSESSDGKLTLDGSLAIESSLDLTLDIDFKSFQLDELSLTFAGKETLVANLVGHGKTSFDKTVPLGSIPFAPIVVPIPTPVGILNVVLTPVVKLEVGMKGSLDGDLEASVTQRATFTAGVGYRDGEFGGVSEDDSDFDVEQPVYDANASIKAWAGPRLEVLIYGAVGPFAGVEGFVEAAANVEGPPICVTGVLDAGLTAKAGVAFLADYSTTLFDHRYPLASFDSCSDDPDAPRPALTWARTYRRANSPGDTTQAVLQASDGGYFVLGESGLFDGVTGFAAATFAMRLDPLGNVIWQRAYQRAEQGLARAAVEVPGGFVVAGTSGVIMLDSGGNVVWAKRYVTDDEVEIASITAQPDGSVVLAGTLGLSMRAWAMKLDDGGNVLWSKGYAGENFTQVRATSDGGTVLSGSIDGANFYVVKLDAEGQVIWQRALDNFYDNSSIDAVEKTFASSDDRAHAALEKPDGNYVVVGESYGNFAIPAPTPLGYYASAVLDLDQNGELVGSTLYRAPATALYGAAYAVAVRPNGSTLVLSQRADDAPDLGVNEDVVLVQEGAFSVFGGPGNDAATNATVAAIGRGSPLQVTADGGALLGLTSNSFAGQDELWLLKLNRTASINFPYRSDLSGTSYRNAFAVSSDPTLPAMDVPITVEAFTSEVKTETTELLSTQQNP